MLSATIAPAVQSSWKEFASTANCGPQRELWLGRHLCRSEDFRSDPLCESRPVNLQIRLLILRHDRRRILWLGATAHPTADRQSVAVGPRWFRKSHRHKENISRNQEKGAFDEGDGSKPPLGRGGGSCVLGFDLEAGASHGHAVAVADFLNRNIVAITLT
jgi:hypothetical protein